MGWLSCVWTGIEVASVETVEHVATQRAYCVTYSPSLNVRIYDPVSNLFDWMTCHLFNLMTSMELSGRVRLLFYTTVKEVLVLCSCVCVCVCVCLCVLLRC